jgi:membrane protein DedA with SNARE-associated domain
MLEHIIGLVIGSERLGLLIIFFILVACGLGLPVPEDISIVASGILVSVKATSFFNAFAICVAGIIIGDGTIYWMGRLFGKKLFKAPIISKIVSDKFLVHGKRAFNRFGNKIIFFARFLPGLRAPIYFLAGSMKVSYPFFLLVDFLAALISVPIWIYIGKIFGENISVLEKAIKHFKLGSILLVLFLILIFIGDYFWKKKLTEIIEKKKS